MPAFLRRPSYESPDSVDPQREERGSILGMFGSPMHHTTPLNSVEQSPRTIRASAAALLNIASPPLSGSNASADARSNRANNGADRTYTELLQTKIDKRDQYISKLRHDLDRMQSALSQYQRDDQTLRRQQLESTHRHSIAIKLWKRTNDGLKSRVECFGNETTPAAAREIANLIRDAAPSNKDSAYLMMLQDQLTKATVKLDHLGSQTEIVLHKGEEVVESLREEMNEVIRDRCRMELELLDQESMLEDDMKRMVVKTERRLKRVQGEVDFLEKKAVNTLKSQSLEEADEENEDQDSDEEDTSSNPNEGEGDNFEQKDDAHNGDEEPVRGKKDETEDEAEVEALAKVGEACIDDEKPAASVNATTPLPAEDAQTPEHLRGELRRIAVDRDRCLSVLQKKLREKNEEYHRLIRLKESRVSSIGKIEQEKCDRDEWHRSRENLLDF